MLRTMQALGSTIAAVAIVTLALQSAAQTPEVGQKAPAISLNTPEGNAVSSTILLQKGPLVVVVLRGYPGYQCPYCVKQVHDFQEHAAEFAQLGSSVLLVYPGPPAALDEHAKEFLAKGNPLANNIHLVIDPDYAFTNQYGLRWDAPHETAYPSTFLIDQHGTIFFRKVSTGHGDRTAAADILAELKLRQHEGK